jgi:glycerol-3-phosphate acyltransferase PlsY
MNVYLVGLPILAFLFGSIPFGLVIGRFFYRTDITKHGSGNIGAMNAMRTIGAKGAIAVLLLDALKGFVPVFIAVHFFAKYFNANGYNDPTFARYVVLVAALAIIGHCFSPWLQFKGGKGVATGFGAIIGIAWPVALIAFIAWTIVAVSTRYSSLSSMFACVVAAVTLWFLSYSLWLTAWGVFITLLIIYTHRDNLNRLRKGTENRIRLSKGS